jgi:hypothetical protein
MVPAGFWAESVAIVPEMRRATMWGDMGDFIGGLGDWGQDSQPGAALANVEDSGIVGIRVAECKRLIVSD